ncbi:phage tail protein [Escherichia coli]|nr:phage tail protein [Escherichia coli]RZA86971.1 phage tail protein [Escherichia coli]HAI5297598.1 phage tail protein [Escherichia coli]HAX9355238.1 phage tail protein [Escherichia coli]HCP7437244.1 phage tail protein [Escherichia coli]HCP8161258.1 phage tail protein [Escherichia coli]
MTVKYYAILTNQGAARLANATMLGSKLNLTQMAVGDANGVLPTPDPAQTKLINQKRIAPLNLLSVDPNNQSQIIAEQIIPENEGGFWIREIGLYDDEGVLIAVANCPETYKPQLQEGSGRTQTIRMILVVTNTEAITLKIDPAVVLATRKYVDDKISEHEKSRRHPDASLTAKGFTQLSSATNSTSETLAATPKAVKAAYDLANGKYTAQDATTARKGLVRLSSATNSTSETLAATPKAVKTVMDEVNKKAPLNSPALTGTPTTPTAPKGTNNTQIASTAYVMAAITALVDSSPEALNTLNELAAALGNDPNFATTMTNALASKQPKDATLTALAGLATSADKLPYFTGADRAALTALTSVGRAIIGKTSTQGVLDYLGLGDGSGRLIKCQVFKSSGTYVPTQGTKFIIVEIVGGGGAGGGCQVGYPNNAACGGGGMSGEYVKARVDNPAVTTVTIGYGGIGVSASVGAPGGTTSFGNTIIAKGGLGGNVLAEGTTPGVVGPYGAYTEPGFTGANIIGSGSGYSSPGVRFSGSLAIGGPGGDSILGAGAGSQAIVGEGINANGHGGGGGGACVYGGATQQRAGGSGMAGIAIIWEYA